MATVTIPTADKFPDGTTLSVYLRESQAASQAKPTGTPVATVATALGVATISGLTEDERYVAWGEVGGEWRRQGFTVNLEADPITVRGVEVATKAQLDALQAIVANLEVGSVDLSGYATTAALSSHAADTTSVHGVADTTALGTSASLTAHSSDTTDVHGIADTTALATTNYVASAVAGIDLTGYATQGYVNSAVSGRQPLPGTMGVAVHGATAGTTRPAGYSRVIWIGSVTPTNAIDGDLYVSTA